MRRYAMVVLCGALLVGAALALNLLPKEVSHRACGGNSFQLVFDGSTGGRFATRCHEKAVEDLIFGAGIVAATLGGTAVSVALLRRETAP